MNIHWLWWMRDGWRANVSGAVCNHSMLPFIKTLKNHINLWSLYLIILGLNHTIMYSYLANHQLKSYILNSYLAILSLYLANLTFFHNYEFTSHKSEFISRKSEFISCNSNVFFLTLWITAYKLRIARYKLTIQIFFLLQFWAYISQYFFCHKM